MTILFVSDKFPPEPTTVGNIVMNDARELQKRGFSVHVFTAVNDRALAGESVMQGIGVTRAYVPLYKGIKRSYLPLVDGAGAKEFRARLARIQPHVVHFHPVVLRLPVTLFKHAKHSGARVFLTLHDMMMFHYGKLIEYIDPNSIELPASFDYHVSSLQQLLRYPRLFIPFRRSIIRHYLKYPEKIVTVSNELAQALMQNGIPVTDTIHNGIGIESWKITDDAAYEFKKKFALENKKVILFVGRMSPFKGVKQLLVALHLIRNQVPNVRLVIVGAKEGYVQKMLEQARTDGLAEQVVATGRLDGDELRAAYASANVLASPSSCFDSFPTVNLEAFASSKPVIATCFGGSKEVVEDGVSGYIVNPYDTQKLAACLEELLLDAKKAEAFGKAGYERVLNGFTLEAHVQQLIDLYQQAPDN